MSQDGNRRLAHWVHLTLLAGVAASGTLLLLGLALMFARNQPRPEGPPEEIWTLLKSSGSGSGPAIIFVGLLLLMSTPLFRVAVLAVGWALEGNRRFALVALVVLGLLALSVAIGVG